MYLYNFLSSYLEVVGIEYVVLPTTFSSMIHRSLFQSSQSSRVGSIFRPRRRSIRAMFNGQKRHHPSIRFFLCFAERRGPGCCCAWADKKGRSFWRFSRYAPRNGQLGRPTRSLCSAGPVSSGSIRCLLLRDLYAQQPRYALLRDWFRRAGSGAQFWRASQHGHGELPKDRPWR